ncbi:hypothetical protein ANN_02446 [Periplaneta americana]|uniref:Uncharacterized protein n=1 Tax=Periplaneta americana TaxID=6978 RepID=A0ABQ8TZJ5_PERAM|nr:hypothetical protein ANN_02446 [Periplaneta americana]
MVGLCEGGNEPPGSLKAILNAEIMVFLCALAIGVAHAKPGFLHGGLHGVAYSAPAAVVAPAAAVVAPAVSLSNQYHAQDSLGQYSYGYSGGPSAKAETKTADGVTRGGYSYLDSNGIVQSASYVSDPVNGFRVAATNLPVHVPTPVHDTPDVVAAKAAHAVAYNEAAAAAAAAPDVSEVVSVAAAPAVYAAAAPAVYAAAPAVYAAAPAVHYAAAPAVVASHGYTAPGIVSSANTAGGFAYSTQSVGPAYAPHYYNAVLPAAVPAAVHAYHGVHAAPVLVNGVPADTPEVAAAKAAHYVAHIEEKARHFG